MSEKLETNTTPELPAGLSRRAAAGTLALLVVCIIVLLIGGIKPRLDSQKERQENQTVLADPEISVVTVQPKPEKAERILSLPGSLEAFQEIKINARIDGYIGKFYVDIGDQVRTGQALARIEAPELVQRRAEAEAGASEARAEVSQAEADVHRISSEFARLQAEEEQARAEVGQNQADIRARQSDAEFARITNERWQRLVSDQAISLQEADQRASAYQGAKANVQSAQEKLLAARSRVKAAQARKVALRAEVDSARARVRSAQAKASARQAVVDNIDAQLAFCVVSAPFAGTITQRCIDVGSLVSAGGGKTTLFELSQSRRLRVFVDVPEADAPAIKLGQKARIQLKEFPTKAYYGVITRTSRVLDKSTRTLRTQIELDNPGGLEAGMHAEVALTVKGSATAVVIPSTSVLVKSEGPKVVTVDEQERVHFRDVTLGLDYGKEIRVERGLTVSERIVNFPADGLVDGCKVRAGAPSLEKTP